MCKLKVFFYMGDFMTENIEKEASVCSETIVHQDVVSHVQAEMIPFEQRLYVAEFFKIMGDPTRISILSALSLKEMCVCDIAVLLNMTQSAISHQLKTLRQARLVKYRRAGKVIYYTLDDDHVQKIIQLGLIHVTE